MKISAIKNVQIRMDLTLVHVSLALCFYLTIHLVKVQIKEAIIAFKLSY